MKDNNFQNDFFESENGGRKGKKIRIPGKYYKQRFLPQIRVPVEYIVIVTITVLVLATISYAVGVERGKKLSGEVKIQKAEKSTYDSEALNSGNVVEDESLDALTERIDKVITESFEPVKEANTKVKEYLPSQEEIIVEEIVTSGANASQEKSVYIIQLATFKHEDSALEALKKLKDRDIEGGVSESGDWYQVYATGYKTISEARKAREALAEEYKDCYIRKVQ